MSSFSKLLDCQTVYYTLEILKVVTFHSLSCTTIFETVQPAQPFLRQFSEQYNPLNYAIIFCSNTLKWRVDYLYNFPRLLYRRYVTFLFIFTVLCNHRVQLTRYPGTVLKGYIQLILQYGMQTLCNHQRIHNRGFSYFKHDENGHTNFDRVV